MSKYYFGIDVGGTEIKFGMFNDSNKLLDSFRIPTPTVNVRVELVETIYTQIIKKLRQDKHEVRELLGIGITIPGLVVDGIVAFCSNIDLGQDFDIVSEIKTRFGSPDLKVVVGNDASLAAFGEYKFLNNSKVKNIVFITLGTGVGGGIIVDGKLIKGFTGSAGEIGHIPYDLSNNRQCGCGSVGCVETVAGTYGMIKTAQDMMKTESSTLKGLDVSPKLIFDHAKEGDLLALKTVDSVAKAIAYMAVTIAVTIDPELFIIGGGISNAGSFLLSKINYHYQKLARFDTIKARFEIAKLGNDAGIYGAYYLVLE